MTWHAGPEALAAFRLASRVRLTSGMTSLLTVSLVSPARKWTRLSLPYCNVSLLLKGQASNETQRDSQDLGFQRPVESSL